jgi:branched-chain amino acid transport system substrate-binding protein
VQAHRCKWRIPLPHHGLVQGREGGLLPPLTLSCRDHEGGGSVQFQQWDGTQWTVLTDWIATDQALVRPLVEAAAAKYAQEKGITPRDCP